MLLSHVVRASFVLVVASRSASSQAWCDVQTAKPYSRNMPGITSVVIGSTTRSSAPIENYPANSYALSRETVTLVPGQTYALAITHSRDSVSFPRAANNIRVWVDYDRDGSFTGPQELVASADQMVPGTSTFSFTVPSKTTPVNGTRMRVTAKMSMQAGHSIPTPCDEPRDPLGYHGEIEDYPVNIAKPPEPEVETRTVDSELGKQYTRIANMLVALAEKMPEEAFAFRPTPETRTFVAAVAHVATANIAQCASLFDKRHALSGTNLEQTLRNKADAVSALKASVAFCTEYLTALKPGELTSRFREVPGRRPQDDAPILMKVSHAVSMTSLVAHQNEMYGYLAVYLRLKGIVPPTSQG